jgi:Concanavalin A-like lectin/glucanases superfamily
MPCIATPRGLTDVQYPWSDAIDNNPCAKKALQRLGLPDPLADSPRGYWSFDERQDTSIIDRSGNGNNGTWLGSGAKVYVPGDPFTKGYAAAFDGQSYISIPSNAALDLGDAWTVEARVNSANPYFGAAQQAAILCKQAGAYELRVDAVTGKLQLLVAGTGPIVTSSINMPLDGQWHHVVGGKSVGGGNGKLYIDGVDVTVVTNPYSAANNTNPLLIGMEGIGLRPWVGLIDEVRIYAGLLTPAQIQARALGKDVSADSLCQFHYQMKYGQNVMQQPILVEP